MTHDDRQRPKEKKATHKCGYAKRLEPISGKPHHAVSFSRQPRLIMRRRRWPLSAGARGVGLTSHFRSCPPGAPVVVLEGHSRPSNLHQSGQIVHRTLRPPPMQRRVLVHVETVSQHGTLSPLHSDSLFTLMAHEHRSSTQFSSQLTPDICQLVQSMVW